MSQVSMHVIGTNPQRIPVDLLSRRLNCHFDRVAEFSVGSHVPQIGDPDLPGGFYSEHRFITLLPQKPQPTNMALIFTEVPLEWNYFAITHKNVSIITTFQADLALHGSEFKLIDYLLLKCIQEAFWLACKVYSDDLDLPPLQVDGGLFHFDRQGCLFNFSAHKHEEQVEKLRWASIDGDCAERARINFHVPDEFINSARQALDGLVKPTLTKSFARMLNNVWLNFTYGALVGALAVNLLSSLITDSADISGASLILLLALAALLVLLPAVVHYVNLRGYSRRHRNE